MSEVWKSKNFVVFIRAFQDQISWSAPNIQNYSFSASERDWAEL